jgi:RNA polymerase sigma-70 factor (ECF subfamily)
MSQALLRRLFNTLVTEHHRHLLAHARVLCQDDRVSPEDLVQDALIIAYERLEDFDQGADFGAWVRGIIRRVRLNQLRRRGATATDPKTMTDLIEDGGRLELDAKELFGSVGHDQPVLIGLQRCIESLPDLLRKGVDLVYFSGRSVEEASQATECSTWVLYKRLSKARELLRRCLAREDDGAMA